MASKKNKEKEHVVMEVDEEKEPLVNVSDHSKHTSKKNKMDDSDSNKVKSTMWDWFTRFNDNEGRDKAMCKHCSKIYAADPRKNGTSALRAHMLTLCHFRLKDNKQKMLSLGEIQEDGVVVGSLKAIKFDEEQCRVALAKMLVVDELPFRFVENEGFRNYSNQLESRFKVPSRTTEDWNNASLFLKLLKLFYTVTLEVSGTKYPTSHLFFQNISMMEHAINSMCESEDLAMSTVTYQMKQKVDKYWGSLDKSNVLLYVAFVLDPQWKLKRLTKCFKAIYDVSRERTMIELIENTLIRLYNQYDTNVSATSTKNNSSQASSSGTSMHQVDVEFSFVAYQKKMFMDDSEEDESTICASEITLYLKEDTLKLQTNFDILNWWKLNSSRFPILSQVARDVLAIPISTVASESAFSTAGCILDPFRSSLAPKTVEAQICARDWLRCKSDLNEVEEMIFDVDKYEELDKELDKEMQIHVRDDDVELTENFT